MENLPQKVHYKDLILRIIGSLAVAHFLNHIGRLEGFFELLTKPFYYRDMFFTFTTLFLVWTYVRQVSIFLDSRYNWKVVPLQRLGLQLFFGWAIAAIVALGLTFIHWHFVLDQRFSESSFFEYEFPIALIFLLLFNVGYFIYFQLKTSELENKLLQEKLNEKTVAQNPVSSSEVSNELSKDANQPAKVLLVSSGERRIPLHIDQIAHIFKDGDYAYINTKDGKKYIIENSLDNLMQLLDENLFYRANRQTIVSFDSCQAFEPLEYGKLELVLEPVSKTPVVVSQKRASDFKRWLKR